MIDLFFLLIPLILLSIGYWTIRLGISPMPTSFSVLQEIKKALPEKVCGTVIDLGSGFGTTLLMLAKKYPNCRIIGYERSPVAYWISKIITLFQKNVSIYNQDFFKISLPDSALFFTYLYPGAMKKLEEKLQRESHKKQLVVSHTFSFQNIQPIKTIKVNDLYKTPIYFFQL